jgi:hypothetical protein
MVGEAYPTKNIYIIYGWWRYLVQYISYNIYFVFVLFLMDEEVEGE